MRRATLLLLLLFAGVLLPGTSLVAHAAREATDFVRRDSDDLLRMGGVWRSRGYGWIWQIADGRVKVYDATPANCVARRSHRGLPGEAGSDAWISRDGRTFRLSVGDRTYKFTFDRVDELPEICRTPPPLTPVALFDASVSAVATHYAFFRERGVNWPRVVRRQRALVRPGMSETDLFSAVSGLISELDDAHVGLEAEVAGDSLEYEPPRKPRPLSADAARRGREVGYWTRDIGPEMAGSLVSVGDGRIKFGLIGDDVGYLYVASTGRTLRRALEGPLDQARKLFADKRALVIDVSKNFGGADILARRLASLFARERVLAYQKSPGDAPGEPLQAVHVEPAPRLLFDGPIYVITSRTTISAAEILVMCLRALPNVTHVGLATRGSLSDILEKRLPNGWLLNLANERYLDHEGGAWEGRGIAPHIEFPVYWRGEAPGDAKAAAEGLLRYVLDLPARSRPTRAR